MALLHEIRDRIANLFFPITCSCCGCCLPHDDCIRICESCFEKLELIKDLYCLKCGKALPDGGELCYVCGKKPSYHFEFIRSAGEYKGLLRKLLHGFKYFDKDFYSRIFNILFKGVLNAEKDFREVDLIVPVPLHWVKRFTRGYNQAEVLAEKVSEYLGTPVMKDALVRAKFTRPQFGLDKDERAKNMANSFRAGKSERIKGKRVLLVDDIATTCATIEQCSFVLKKAGAAKIYALTVARD